MQHTYSLLEERKAPVLDQKPARKSFSLDDILSLSTGLLLSKEGVHALHRLVAFVMETEATPAATARFGKEVRNCLQEQLPFLRDIPLEGLHAIYKYDPSAKNPYLDVWLEMQALRYGDEHYLVPLSRWKRRKASYVL